MLHNHLFSEILFSRPTISCIINIFHHILGGTMKKYLSARNLVQLGSLILGNGLLAFAVAAFVSPSGIIMGGSTGIGLALQVSFSDRNQVLYGILFLILQTLTLNKIIVSGKTQIQLLIMSGHTDAIREQLLHQEDVGVTLFRTESGFTQTESNAILCITSRRKLHSVLDMINETDPDAFITIHEVKFAFTSSSSGNSALRARLSRASVFQHKETPEPIQSRGSLSISFIMQASKYSP